MLKVLLVDSWLLNNKVIEQDSQTYFEKNNIEYQFFECANPEQTIDLLHKEKIDIAYIDISSEDFDGIQLVKDIKNMDIQQPKMVAVTVLYDKKFRYEALKLKVYRYIYKPYDFYEIQETLDKLFNGHNYSLGINQYFKSLNEEPPKSQIETTDDEFLDFDEFDDEDSDKNNQDDFFEFDEFDEFDEDQEDDIKHSKDLMDAYNQSHKKVSATELLANYDTVGIDLEELNDLEEDLDAIIASLLFDDLEERLPDVIYILEKYNRFLYTFSEFDELCKVIHGLVSILEETDFSQVKRKNIVSKFIVAILEDLVDWKEHVFVKQDAVDVYYINASILNSFVLVKDIINK